MSEGKMLPGAYRLYPATATAEQVRAAYAAMHGREPARVARTGGGWLAGPVEEPRHPPMIDISS